MVTVFGFSFPLPEQLSFLSPEVASFIFTGLAWALVAFLAYLVLTYVLRAFTHQLDGELEEILLGIFRRPLILLILGFGLVNSLEILPLPDSTTELLTKIFNTFLILIVLHLAWRLVRDVFVFYGRTWAKRTESKVDDNLIPVLNLFGPIIIVVTGFMVILPMWGFNITTVLLGAGVVGIILGLALQDSLSNLFSGMSLVVEAAFQVGDLLVMPDGSVCEVQQIGLRSTQLYSLSHHSAVNMPNNLLANDRLINITKPTVEQRSHIDLRIPLEADLLQIQEQLESIASSQPGVLVDDLRQKIKLVQQQLERLKQRRETILEDSPLADRLNTEIRGYELSITRLEREHEMNTNLANFRQLLINMANDIDLREHRGFDMDERKALLAEHAPEIESTLEKLVQATRAWCDTPDGWATAAEMQTVRQIWLVRNERLQEHWKDLKDELEKPRDHLEMMLDVRTRKLVDWLTSSYKILPEVWKNPRVTFKGFDGKDAKLELSFYVDNIRLEHDLRLPRVTTDIAHEIRLQQIL